MNNWLIFFVSFIFIICSTLIIQKIEPATFPTVFEGFWWVMTTVTTVGYGDYYPVSTAGRLYAIFLYLVGIGLIGVVLGKIIDGFSSFHRKREEGKLDYKGKNHFVIIGWSKKAEYAIDEILESNHKHDIVLIDLLEKNPYSDRNIIYIQGSASDEKTLIKANIMESKAIIIFADDKIPDSQLADGKSLLIAAAVERLSKTAHTTVELMHEEHIKHFQHVHVDEFVLTHETISRMAVRSAFTKGISTVYSQLMSHKHGDDLYQITPRAHWKTYREAFEELLNEGATLIADRDQINISRRLDDAIPAGSQLYIISDKRTYAKISKQSPH